MKFAQLTAAASLFFASAVFGQVFPTAPPDHVHISVPEPAQAADWYVKHFDGKKVPDLRPNQPDQVGYGRTVFRFWKRDYKPSDGSVLDRVGFTVSDVDAKVAEVQAAGGKVLRPPQDVQGLKIRVAFVEDPWGTKVEVLHDPDLPNRLFLIAVRAPDPEPLMKWLGDTFGGVREKYQGRFEGLKYGDLWVLVQKSDGDVEPSAGHSLDHLGWPVPNMSDALTKLKSLDYKVTVDPPRASPPLMLSYIEGPNGLSVELTQFPAGGAPQ